MAIYRVNKDPNNPYVMLNKNYISDDRLSWRAKGILTYLLSKPDDWQVYRSDIINHAKDGRDSVTAGLKELLECGYIVRNQTRDDAGKISGYDYDVFEVPEAGAGNSATGAGNTGDGKTGDGKSVTTNNRSVPKNDQTNKIDSGTTEYSKEFESFWEAYPRKVEKKAAYLKFKEKKNKYSVIEIINAARNYAEQCRINETEECYIKHPKTFLGPQDHVGEWKDKKPRKMKPSDNGQKYTGPQPVTRRLN